MPDNWKLMCKYSISPYFLSFSFFLLHKSYIIRPIDTSLILTNRNISSHFWMLLERSAKKSKIYISSTLKCLISESLLGTWVKISMLNYKVFCCWTCLFFLFFLFETSIAALIPWPIYCCILVVSFQMQIAMWIKICFGLNYQLW